jgi:hypothetical protein
MEQRKNQKTSESKKLFPIDLFNVYELNGQFQKESHSRCKIEGQMIHFETKIPGVASDENVFDYKFTRLFKKKFGLNTRLTYTSHISKEEPCNIVNYCYLSFWQRQRLMWAFGKHWFQQEKNLLWTATMFLSLVALVISISK